MVVALAAYLTVGVILPIITTKLAREDGRRYRELVGEMNDFFLDSVRGMKEIQLFGYAKQRLDEIQQRSQKIDTAFERIKDQEAKVRVYTEVAVSAFNILMLFTGLILFSLDKIDFSAFLIGVILLMSSYGPVIALSNLSSNLLQTLASGESVLSLLAEEPELKDVKNAVDLKDVSRIDVENVSFAYGEEQILSDVSLSVKKGEILGIHGRSGSGKSTLLKLLMRFYDVHSGVIRMGDRKLSGINTNELRDMESYVTQETCLFHDSIANNIAIAKPGASREEIVEAAKKASLHEFIESLPNGYDTLVGELGDTLSGGEKQRIGVARAFLHDAPLLLLDEPTSNLDSLNESIILRSLKKMGKDKTVILVSHRESTMAVAEKVYQMENGRIS